LTDRFLVLGAGYVGARVAHLARTRGHAVVAAVRSAVSAETLRAKGFQVLVTERLDGDIAAHVDAATHVCIAFPPDGETDQRIAPALAGAASISYVSTTGVYDDRRGDIDDDTPIPSEPSARSQRYLAAEALYRAMKGTVLRSPAIYGPDRGLHVLVKSGRHQIPGDGSRFISRIHADDLAELLFAARLVQGETFVVGDLGPARHIEVVRFICERFALPLPPFAPLESAPTSLRADRRVHPERALARLGVTLRYPTYREGMAAAVSSPIQVS
jgi:nucleoside-diphosphate-sugar epimerase